MARLPRDEDDFSNDADEVNTLLATENGRLRGDGKLGDGQGTANSRAGEKASSENFSSRVRGRVRGYTRMVLDNYVLLAVFASVGGSMNATCLKIMSTNISILQIVAIRSITCFMILFLLCLYKGIPLTEPRTKVPFFALRGVLGAAAFLCMAVSTFELPLSESSFINNSYPAVTAVFSWVIGMEQLGFFSWSGVLGCLVGNAMMAQPPILFGGHEDWGTGRVIGLASAVGGNFFMASMFIILRFLGKDVNSFVLAAYMHFVSFLFCLPFLFVGFPMAVNSRHSSGEILCYIAVSLLGILVQCSMCRALQVGPPTKATAILMTNMLLSAAFGMIALSEKTSWISKLGAAVILVSVILVVSQRSAEKKTIYKLVSAVEEKEEIQLTIQTTSD